jgi:hypothetical protein
MWKLALMLFHMKASGRLYVQWELSRFTMPNPNKSKISKIPLVDFETPSRFKS